MGIVVVVGHGGIMGSVEGNTGFWWGNGRIETTWKTLDNKKIEFQVLGYERRQ
jgi:hypothetical protein